MARNPGLRALLDGHAAGDPDEVLRLGELMAGLGRNAFGVLLLIATLPAFIPIPVGGAISGPLVMLIGVQLMAGLSRPWLPRFVADRGPHRHALVRFDQRISPWLARLEKLVRPRLDGLLVHRGAEMFSGLLLVLLGLLLSLPIPLTNYLFGGLLLLFALALLERDGALLLAGWVLGTATLLAVGLLSGNAATLAARGIDHLF